MTPVRGILVTIILSILVLSSYSQLTFTPVWGKRSNGLFNPSTTMAVGQPSCKGSTETLMEIFRFVQIEAQKFLDCNQK